MSAAIRIANLSKLYRIGVRGKGEYRTLREVLTHAAAARLRRVTVRSAPASPAPPAPDPSQFWALRDLSFEIEPGEVVGIIGRNGAGKSTLLKVLSRITEPTFGRVELEGRLGSLLEVGTGFHPELTGRENVYLNGSIIGMSRREIAAKFDEIVAFADIGEFLDTPVKRYSSGMYVRLAFAVAAHLETEILVIDEVLAVGDAAFQRRCLGRVGEIAGTDRTVLLVSHNMGAVRNFCTRAVWIEAGRVLKDGSPNEVVDAYVRQTTVAPTGVVDLSRAVRSRDRGGGLRLLSIELNDGTPIYHGERFKCRIRYKAIRDCHSVSFGLGFCNSDGVRLLSVDSDVGLTPEECHRFELSAEAEGAAEFRLDHLLLQPGPYILDVGARSGDNYALEYLPGCGRIEVLPGPSTPGAIIRDGACGRFPAEWELDGRPVAAVRI